MPGLVVTILLGLVVTGKTISSWLQLLIDGEEGDNVQDHIYVITMS